MAEARREEFWGQLRNSTAAKERAREDAARAEFERTRPQRDTLQAVELAAHGTAGRPVKGPFKSFPIDTTQWAAWIWDAARAWKRCPGMAALQERPVPAQGAGIEAGLRIFKIAAEATTLDAVVQELEDARAVLRMTKLDLFDLGLLDSEYGLWVFFKELHRHLGDDGSWGPPSAPLRTRAGAATKLAGKGNPAVRENARLRSSAPPSSPTPGIEPPGGVLCGWPRILKQFVSGKMDKVESRRARETLKAVPGLIVYEGRRPLCDALALHTFMRELGRRRRSAPADR